MVLMYIDACGSLKAGNTTEDVPMAQIGLPFLQEGRDMGAHPTRCSHCSPPADPPDRKPTADAADYCGPAPPTLRYYRHAGVGPVSYRIGSKVYYDRADLDDWLTAKKDASMRRGRDVGTYHFLSQIADRGWQLRSINRWQK